MAFTSVASCAAPNQEVHYPQPLGQNTATAAGRSTGFLKKVPLFMGKEPSGKNAVSESQSKNTEHKSLWGQESNFASCSPFDLALSGQLGVQAALHDTATLGRSHTRSGHCLSGGTVVSVLLPLWRMAENWHCRYKVQIKGHAAGKSHSPAGGVLVLNRVHILPQALRG